MWQETMVRDWDSAPFILSRVERWTSKWVASKPSKLWVNREKGRKCCFLFLYFLLFWESWVPTQSLRCPRREETKNTPSKQKSRSTSSSSGHSVVIIASYLLPLEAPALWPSLKSLNLPGCSRGFEQSPSPRHSLQDLYHPLDWLHVTPLYFPFIKPSLENCGQWNWVQGPTP